MRSFTIGLCISLMTGFIVWQGLLAMNETAKLYQECGGVYCEMSEHDR